VPDAVVVGAGPNGLAAAITLARAGVSVVVLEAADKPGGGTRSEELTLPGFVHDVCSAIHPLGVSSPFFLDVPLTDFGLEWVHPETPVAHPLPDGRAGVIEQSLDETVSALGRDGAAWRRMVTPLVRRWEGFAESVLGPMLRVPPHPLTLTRFGIRALPPAVMLARTLFREDAARAAFVGLAAHAILDLRLPMTSSFGVMFAAAAHVGGWPAARGGSQRIADAMVAYLESMGGEVVTGYRVRSLADLPESKVALFDTTPRHLVEIAGDRIPTRFRTRLERFRYGPAAFKVDYALDGPVPWKAEACRRAGSVHVCGTLDEVAAAEADVTKGRHPERPFVICTQPSLFDESRAPAGKHTLWAYCHTPSGSTVDMLPAVEAQIERFAPGFRDLVLARSVMAPADVEAHGINYIGGDIAGGSHGGLQLVARPVLSTDPYKVPVDGLPTYLCSSSTPPGAGVHGMCGWWAAKSALKRLGG
jgi:phytoene dehydrogenase-like protein